MNKRYATILLDQKDQYVYTDNSLPERPSWDKELLAAMLDGEGISMAGYDILPFSLRKTVSITHGEPTGLVTIAEISALTDILIVVRSPSYKQIGKVFRLDNFEPIVKSGELEIWRRK